MKKVSLMAIILSFLAAPCFAVSIGSGSGTIANEDVGTLTNGYYCTYVTGTGFVCNTQYPVPNWASPDAAIGSNTPVAGTFTEVNVVRTDAPQSVELYEATSDGDNKGTITAPAKGTGLTSNRTYTMPDATGIVALTSNLTPSVVDVSSTQSLTADQVLNKFHTNLGQSAASTQSLPASATGQNFLLTIETKVAENLVYSRNGSDTICLTESDGTLTCSLTTLTINDADVGGSMACWCPTAGKWYCKATCAVTGS